MKDIELLVQRWDEQTAQLLRPERPQEVVAAFGAVGYNATTDVISLYEHCGGMEQMDDEYWRLWSLSEVIERNADSSASGVLFGDYLLDCWAYRLRPVSEDVSAVFVEHFDGQDLVEVAPSLEAFIAGLLSDPMEMLEHRSTHGRNDP